MHRMRMHESYMYILFQLKVLREVLFAENILRCAIRVGERKVAGRPRWQTRCQGSLDKLQILTLRKKLSYNSNRRIIE